MDYFTVKTKSKSKKSPSKTKSKTMSKSKSGSKSKSKSASKMSMVRKHKNKLAAAGGVAGLAALALGAKKFNDAYKLRNDQAHNRSEFAKQLYRSFRLFPKKDQA